MPGYIVYGVLLILSSLQDYIPWRITLRLSKFLQMDETTVSGRDCLCMPLFWFTITLGNFCLINIIFTKTREKGKSRKRSLVLRLSSYNVTGHQGHWYGCAIQPDLGSWAFRVLLRSFQYCIPHRPSLF